MAGLLDIRREDGLLRVARDVQTKGSRGGARPHPKRRERGRLPGGKHRTELGGLGGVQALRLRAFDLAAPITSTAAAPVSRSTSSRRSSGTSMAPSRGSRASPRIPKRIAALDRFEEAHHQLAVL